MLCLDDVTGLVFLRKPIAYSAVILGQCHVTGKKLSKESTKARKRHRNEGKRHRKEGKGHRKEGSDEPFSTF